MAPVGDLLYLIIGIAVVAVAVVVGFVTTGVKRGRRPRGGTDVLTRPTPPTEAPPRDGRPGGATLLEPPVAEPQPSAPVLDRPESAAGRLVRLRQRLSRSQGTLGRGLLALLSRDRVDEDTWEEIEDTLLTADIGVMPITGYAWG